MTWEIASVRYDRARVLVTLKAGDTIRQVYLTAGIIAALGLTKPPVYDGKPGKPEVGHG